MSYNIILPNLLKVTAAEIRQLHRSSALTAVSFVQSILTLIETDNQAGLGLSALISVAPHPDVLEITRRLEDENSQGKA